MKESLTGQGSPSYTGIRNMPGPATITETGANPGPAVKALEKTVDDLKDRTARDDSVAKAKREIEEESGTPAPGMDEDGRYKRIETELLKKWQEENGGEWLSAGMQDYMYGTGSDGRSLKVDTERQFRGSFPKDAVGYDAKEPTRIYEDSSRDPAINKVETDIRNRVFNDSEVVSARNGHDGARYRQVHDSVEAREALNAWDRFVSLYPEKAKAYGKKGHKRISRALQRQERSSQEQERQAQVLAQKRAEAPVQDQQEQLAESRQTETAPVEAQATEAVIEEPTVEEAATPKKNEGPFLPNRIAKDPHFRTIERQLYNQAKQQGNEIDIRSLDEQALVIYYQDLARNLTQKGVPKEVLRDRLYQQELSKLITQAKDSKVIDKDKLKEQAVANYLRAKDIEIAKEQDENKKKRLISFFKQVLIVIGATFIPPAWDTVSKAAQPAR